MSSILLVRFVQQFFGQTNNFCGRSHSANQKTPYWDSGGCHRGMFTFWCRLFYYSIQNYKVRGRRRRNACPCLECVTDHVDEATHTLVWSRAFSRTFRKWVQIFCVILLNCHVLNLNYGNCIGIDGVMQSLREGVPQSLKVPAIYYVVLMSPVHRCFDTYFWRLFITFLAIINRKMCCK